ncbi:hypothetical protein [Terasakiella sp.]|uniref:hypothetical protein n=1 Tax=Terasakiella sp. TaxID=2034861 RepID=UPI003AA85FB3
MSYVNAFLLLLTLCSTIVFKTQGVGEMLFIASGAVLLFLALTWQKVSRPGKIFIAINIVMLVLFWGDGVDRAIVEQGFSRVILFSAFMIALVFLRVAAKRSLIISRCGNFLINQKPGKRYAVLSYGSCLLGAILSFGALNLMGQVIANGNTLEAAKGDSRIHLIRLQRMVLAMLRGFSTLPLSSPFSISMALVLSIIPALEWQSLIPLSLVFAIVLIGLGWIMDYRAYPPPKSGAGLIAGQRKNFQAVLAFIVIVLCLFGLSGGLSMYMGYGLPTSILLVSPLFGLVWFLIEGGLSGFGLKSVSMQFSQNLGQELNAMSSEVAVIGGASFTGSLVAAIIPADLVQSLTGSMGLEGFALAVFCALMVTGTSIVGVSPFVSVTILASTFANVAAFGLSPYVLALSLLIGWAMALNASPLTISTILIGRILDCRPRDITLVWNLRYSCAALSAVIAILYVFHLIYD